MLRAHAFVGPAHERLRRTAETLFDAALSRDTKAQYNSRNKQTDAWCALYHLGALPMTAETLALYISDLERRGFASETIRGRLTAIKDRHLCRGLPDPTAEPKIHKLVSAVRRAAARAGERRPQRRDMLHADFLALIDAIGATRKDLRDKAWMLLAYAAALRPQEISALQVAQIRWTPGEDTGGFQIVHDNERLPTYVSRALDASHCAVSHVRAWLREENITTGPVFPTMHSLRRGEPSALNRIQLNRITRQRCAAANLSHCYTTSSLSTAQAVQGGEKSQRLSDVVAHCGLSPRVAQRYMEVGRERKRLAGELVWQPPTSNKRTSAAFSELCELLDLHRNELLSLFQVHARELAQWRRKPIPVHRRTEVFGLFDLARRLSKPLGRHLPRAIRMPLPALDDRSLLTCLTEDGVAHVALLLANNPHLVDALRSAMTPPRKRT